MEYTDRAKMYDEFCNYLSTLGVPAVSTEYYDTNFISIYVKKISDIQYIKEIAKQYSQEIIKNFKELLERYNYQGDYNKYEWDSYSVTNVYSQDARYIDNLVRNSKKEIEVQIKDKIVSECCPLYIFCSSSCYENGYFPAGYSLVFENEEIFRKSEQKVQDQIRDICNKTLIKNDKEGIFSSEYLILSFYYKGNCNLYGLSRED